MRSSFSLGGVTAEELGLVMMRESQRPILPQTRDYTQTIPGRNGVYDFGADMEARSIDLQCRFITRNASELQQRITQLAQHMVDSYGRPRTMELIFTLQPDRYFLARYSGNMPVERLVGMGTFSLPLVASDPFSYSVQEQIIEQQITTSPFVMEAESNGNVRTQPVIILTNQGSTTITHFTITNEYRLE